MNEVKVVEVDAHLAKEWLSRNSHNRPIAWMLVSRYAKDMMGGRWMLTTDCIGFDTEDRLIQGQHRLHAILEAEEFQPGIKIPMMVAWGFPPSTYHVLDQGRLRSTAHVLQASGMTNTTVTGAMSRTLLFYDTYPENIWRSNYPITKVEIIDFALEHREDLVVSGKQLPYPVNWVSWCVLRYLVHRDSAHADRWEEWEHAVRTGENLGPGHPALAMRNTKLANPWGLAGAQSRLGAYIKAWNAFIEGRTIQHLLFRRNELPMPKVV